MNNITHLSVIVGLIIRIAKKYSQSFQACSIRPRHKMLGSDSPILKSPSKAGKSQSTHALQNNKVYRESSLVSSFSIFFFWYSFQPVQFSNFFLFSRGAARSEQICRFSVNKTYIICSIESSTSFCTSCS